MNGSIERTSLSADSLPQSGLVQYMFCDPDILRHDSERSSKDVTSGLGSKADLSAPKSDFRYTPDSGLKMDIAPCPFRANRRHRSRMAVQSAGIVN